MTALAELNQRIEKMRGFEREYRLQQRQHLEGCMAALDSHEPGLPLRAAARRLAEAPAADLRVVLAGLAEEKRQRLLETLLRTPVDASGVPS